MKLTFGKSASSIYGVIFSFTGLANLIIIFVTGSNFGKNYAQVIQMSAGMSAVAFLLLIFAFKEKQIYLTPRPEAMRELLVK